MVLSVLVVSVFRLPPALALCLLQIACFVRHGSAAAVAIAIYILLNHWPNLEKSLSKYCKSCWRLFREAQL